MRASFIFSPHLWKCRSFYSQHFLYFFILCALYFLRFLFLFFSAFYFSRMGRQDSDGRNGSLLQCTQTHRRMIHWICIVFFKKLSSSYAENLIFLLICYYLSLMTTPLGDQHWALGLDGTVEALTVVRPALRGAVVLANRPLSLSISSPRNSQFDSSVEELDRKHQKLFLLLFVCLLIFFRTFRTGNMRACGNWNFFGSIGIIPVLCKCRCWSMEVIHSINDCCCKSPISPD